MGNLISRNAPMADILQDVHDTLTRAELKSVLHLEEAQRYLQEVFDQALGLGEQVDEKMATVRRLRAERDAANGVSDDLVREIHDLLFNQIGRVSGDPWFLLVMPKRAGGYTQRPAAKKGVALEVFAKTLVAHPHKLVPAATAQAHADALLEQAKKMAEALGALDHAATELEVLRAQRAAAVKRAQNRLSALKKFWLAEGMTQADIHEVIPDRPRARPSWVPAVVEDATDEEASREEPPLEDEAAPEGGPDVIDELAAK